MDFYESRYLTVYLSYINNDNKETKDTNRSILRSYFDTYIANNKIDSKLNDLLKIQILDMNFNYAHIALVINKDELK